MGLTFSTPGLVIIKNTKKYFIEGPGAGADSEGCLQPGADSQESQTPGTHLIPRQQNQSPIRWVIYFNEMKKMKIKIAIVCCEFCFVTPNEIHMTRLQVIVLVQRAIK